MALQCIQLMRIRDVRKANEERRQNEERGALEGKYSISRRKEKLDQMLLDRASKKMDS